MRKLALVLTVVCMMTLGLASANAAGGCKAKQEAGCPKTECPKKQECKSENKQQCKADCKEACCQKEGCQKACPADETN